MSKQEEEKTEPKLEQGVKVRRLLKLAIPEWKWLTVGTVFLLIGSGMGLLYPQAVRIIIDSTLKETNTEKLNIAALAMVGIFIVQGFAVALRYYLFTIAGERIVARLRQTLYNRIIIQEVAFFDERRTGELTNRLASDTTVLQNTVSVNISMVLRNIAMALGGSLFLVYTSPKLSLLILFIVPPVAIGAVYFGRKIRKFSRDVQDALAEASEVAEETISGVRTVRSFSQEDRETERYGGSIEKSFDLARFRARFTAVFSAGITTAGYGAIALVFWYGGGLVIEKQMSLGDLTSFLLYTLTIAISLSTLAGLWADFMRASGAAERVFALIDRVPTIPIDEGKKLDHIDGHIEFKKASFSYPTRPDMTVLHELDFEIAPGEVIALVGPSGGGKSTVASLIARFYDPQEGSIQLDGNDLKDLNASWLRQNIGIVPQEPILFSTSITDNIRYGRNDATQEELEDAARAANAHDFVMNFPEQYETSVGERGVQLSGGQKQRVAIARAILKNPRILLLDEATSALDAESEHLVKEALDRLMQKRTTLIIAHRLSTVKDASRVLVIEQGRIIQQGKHDELFAQEEGLYRKLVERQMIGEESHPLPTKTQELP